MTSLVRLRRKSCWKNWFRRLRLRALVRAGSRAGRWCRPPVEPDKSGLDLDTHALLVIKREGLPCEPRAPSPDWHAPMEEARCYWLLHSKTAALVPPPPPLSYPPAPFALPLPRPGLCQRNMSPLVRLGSASGAAKELTLLYTLRMRTRRSVRHACSVLG